MNEVKHYIDGKYEVSERTFTRKSPKSDQEFSIVPDGDAVAVAGAVAAAKRAFPTWKALSVATRANYVMKMSAWLVSQYGQEGEATRLKCLISDEIGKPLPEADIEVIETSDFLAFFANVAQSTLESKKLELDDTLWPTKTSRVQYEPKGVVAIIKPWNYPLEMIAWALAPALIAGNTVVIKPSEKSSVVAHMFSEMAEDVGLPFGVLNIVYGGADTGRFLVSSKDINHVTFTGSVTAGREIAKTCAEKLCSSSIELGGNDAALVLSDADVELAARGVVWGSFCNAGQVCVGIKRALVMSNVYDAFLSRVTELTRQIRLAVDMGPIVDEHQLDAVDLMVRDALQKGATLVTGGGRDASIPGYYYKPTILTSINQEMRLWHEECFGPLLPVMKVNDERELLTLANASDFGLGASIWGQNVSQMERLADKLDVGAIWFNDVNVAFPQAPWGGRKNSGVGFELSTESLLSYSNRKHLCYEVGSSSDRAWWFPY